MVLLIKKDKNMKIFYIANSRIPTEKAHGVQISKMCEAFANSNIEIELLIPARFNHIKESIFEYYNIKNNFFVKRLFTIDAINVIKNKVGFVIQNISFAFSVLFYLLTIKGNLTVYSRDYFSLFLLSFFKKFNLFYEIHSFPDKQIFFYRFLLNKIKFIAISGGLKKELINSSVKEENILVAHDGVDLDLFNTIDNNKIVLRKNIDLPQNKKIIAYIGKLTTMGKSKGVEFLIESFSKVLNEIADAYLLIVGINKEEIGVIQDIFKSFNIDQTSYKLVTHVNHLKVIEYEKASNVLIMNYPNTKHYQLYMSPLKMFEYMASSVPIVSSDLPSVREVLNNHNAVLVEPDNVRELVNGIKRILLDNDLSVKIANKALQDIKQYTWKNRVSNILEFLNKNR